MLIRLSPLVALLLIVSSSGAAEPRQPFAQQLATESDALVRDAIRRPYGWAWDAAAARESAARAAPRQVIMEPMGSPAAGVVLLWAGQLLHEPRYEHAAEQVVHGICASQAAAGQIPPRPLFGSAAGGRPESAPVPDRASTRAALGLFLAMMDQTAAATQPVSERPGGETLKRAAVRTAYWLVKQQCANGMWCSPIPSRRFSGGIDLIVRLDDGDYRDSTMALLLAADVLDDEQLRRASRRPLDALTRLRLVRDAHGPNLWSTACTADGSDVPQDYPNGPDVLASRYAMQSLLAGYLFTGQRDYGIALDEAATSLRDTRLPDGLWNRFLDPTAAADVARASTSDGSAAPLTATQPTTTVGSPAKSLRVPATRFVVSEPWTSGSFGIPSVIDATARLKPIGRERYTALLGAGFTLRQQAIATICGLLEDPLTIDFPVTPEELPAYLAAHEDLWRLTQGSMPEDLSGRVRRLWVLLIRAKLETLAR